MISEIKKHLSETMGIDDAETIAILLEQFFDAINSNLTALQQADGRDFAKLHQYAHTIKGCAANVGLESMRLAAMAVDSASKSGDFNGVNANLPELQELVMQFNQEYNIFRK